MQATKCFEEDDASSRLEELQLSLEDVLYAVGFGEAAANSCTKNDPVTLSGMLRWGRTLRGLRDRCGRNGWKLSRSGGLETIVSPCGKRAIAVTTGNANTGLGPAPKSKYPKGPTTESAVSSNEQLWLFPPERPAKVDGQRQTWILLLSPGEEQVFCELSLPVSIGSDGRIDGWLERIILPPVDRDQLPDVVPKDSGPDIDIPVVRKTS